MNIPLLTGARSERRARAYRYTGMGEQPVGPVGREVVLVCESAEFRCGHAHTSASALQKCANALSVRLHSEGKIRWASDERETSCCGSCEGTD